MRYTHQDEFGRPYRYADGEFIPVLSEPVPPPARYLPMTFIRNPEVFGEAAYKEDLERYGENELDPLPRGVNEDWSDTTKWLLVGIIAWMLQQWL